MRPADRIRFLACLPLGRSVPVVGFGFLFWVGLALDWKICFVFFIILVSAAAGTIGDWLMLMKKEREKEKETEKSEREK